MKYRIRLKADDDIAAENIMIGRVPALVIRPKEPVREAPGILWIHGGGYILGMKEMVYMKARAGELGINKNQIMVGGESAGGGLCAALCMLARDKGSVNIAFQMPLYPMLNNFDTESSENNRGKIWNTRRNHFGWKMYLRGRAETSVSPYAAPAGQTNWKGLPPAYTFVGDGEPFYSETLTFVKNLQEAGVEARADVYHSDMHAFDMLRPDLPESRRAISRFEEVFSDAMKRCFAEND